MPNEIELTGCTPEPLMSYLKALGVFRLVAEQADPAACFYWRNGNAVLQSTLDQESLERFYLNEYKPTPIMAPWNGGSGFYGGGSAPLTAIEHSKLDRFNLYRESIARIRTVIPDSKPKDDDKRSLLTRCRSVLHDDVIPWLDACFVLGEDSPTYFPLLGTGGNDGRLDFTNNFMQRIAEVIALTAKDHPPPTAPELWRSSVFANTLVSLGQSAIGQFNPGGIGGPNGTQGRFEAGSKVNPWDFILMIEGALFFAGSIARRLGATGSSKSVFPFAVDSVAIGYGSSTVSEETTDGSRAELWLPIWNEPATLLELRHLMSEGRAKLGRQQARNAVEFALAVNLLGVDRGIHSFARFGFLKRNGLAFLAAPLGRIEVTARPNSRLLDDAPFRERVERLRRACNDKEKTPGRYQSALRNLDRSVFAFATRSEVGNDAPYLLQVLRAIGDAERTLANGLAFAKDKFIRPLSGLNSQWLAQANDDSPEFRLAASLAGIRATTKREVGPIRAYLEEVEVTNFVNWSPGSTSAVWCKQSVAKNLAAVFRRRQLEAFQNGIEGVPIHSRCFARLDDVVAFLNEETDDEKLADLLWGLICIDFPGEHTWFQPSVQEIPVEFGLPRLLVESWHTDDGEPIATHDPEVFNHLTTSRSDAISESVTMAARRLKSGGVLAVGYRNRRHSGHALKVVTALDPVRLLATMLFPLSNHDLNRIAESVLYPAESTETSHVD